MSVSHERKQHLITLCDFSKAMPLISNMSRARTQLFIVSTAIFLLFHKLYVSKLWELCCWHFYSFETVEGKTFSYII